MPAAELELILQERIAAQGSISFAEFMALSLYHPQHGYYARDRQIIGRAGDFFTSVSVGPLFGRLLADGFHREWQRLGCPQQWQIVEQGANRGELAVDLLLRLRELSPEAFAACRYLVVEPLPTLQQVQRDSLAARQLADKLQHLSSLTELPEKSLYGVYFSNELADAFPVRRVQFTAAGWQELRVGWDATAGRLHWVTTPADSELLVLIRDWGIPQLPGYCAELSPHLAEWVHGVASRLAAGIFLTIDYGAKAEELYQAERQEGTLRAYRQHRQLTDLLANPGEQDLTAQVNFSRIIHCSINEGMKVRSYTDQHHYMVELGQLSFFQEMEEMIHSDPTRMNKAMRAYKTLMHTEMMGALFKVLLLEINS